MIFLAVSFILGIASFYSLPFFPISINLLIVVTYGYLFVRNKNKKLLLITILFFTFGFFYSFSRYHPLPETRLPSEKVSIKGMIADVPEISEKNIRFTLKNIFIEGKNLKGEIRMYFSLDEPAKADISLSTGDRISAVTRLKEPNTFQNPGVYSYDLKKDGVIAVGFTDEMRIHGRESGIRTWAGRSRQRLGRIIDNSLSPDNASFIKAIITGLKRGIGQDLRDSFSSTGLAHLLSISGTHFGLLAFIIFQSVKRACNFLPDKVFKIMTLYITPTQIAVVATLPLLVLYVLISGAGTPTIRSFIMVLIYMLALFLGRKGQWLNSLSIAAFIILIWHPEALFDVSFHLSFMAVLSIGCVMEKKTEKDSGDRIQNSEKKGPIPFYSKKILEKLRTSLLITVAAVLGTAPFIAIYFKQFPLISPIANLVVTPLVCFIILPLGFFTGFSALISGLGILPLNGVIELLTGFAIYLIRFFSSIPYSNLHIHNPSFLFIVFYYLSCLFIVKSSAKWRILPLIFIIFIYLAGPYWSDDGFRITFLDVGQGESSVLELPDGKVMLIDGGTSSPDTGRMVVAPYLWSRGIRKIDYMVLSHPHPDHYGGLLYIVNNFKVGEVWTNGRSSHWMMELIDNAKAQRIKFKTLRRGELFETKDYKVYVLHPYDGFYAGSSRGEFSDENSDSLVLKIESDGGSLLFTGDIEMEAEDNLLHLGKWLRSDIIKVPHHGGKTSSTMEFLKSVSAELAVVSVGRNNPYYHPHGSTVRRYRETGARLLRTDRDGAVIVTLKDGGYVIQRFSDSRFKKADRWQDEARNLRLLF